MLPTIRPLDPAEVPLVAAFYRAAPDYWLLAEGRIDPDRQAAEFFSDCPPGCDPATSERLGLFLADAPAQGPGLPGASPPPRGEGRGVGGPGPGPEGRLSGVAELSFGFPQAGDAYLGLMLLGPWAQGRGLGRALLAEVEARARARGAPRLYLAVLEANPRGRAFWAREGFTATGRTGTDAATGHVLHRLVKPLAGAAG
jgi:GNAT superfamily N-acetyltransferase